MLALDLPYAGAVLGQFAQLTVDHVIHAPKQHYYFDAASHYGLGSSPMSFAARHLASPFCIKPDVLRNELSVGSEIPQRLTTGTSPSRV